VLPLFAQLETGLQVVDKAAAASDRWLFLAALAIIISGAVLAIRYLVASMEKKDVTHASVLERIAAEHSRERSEWRAAQLEAKAQFLEALRQQRVDFREELAVERTTSVKLAEVASALTSRLAKAA